jgi:N-acetylmuramoyl-L-alanine amidase
MNGVAVFYSETNPKANESKAIGEIFVKELKFRNGSMPNTLNRANFVVLRLANIPSVMLELGYISNPEDLSYLVSTEYQKNLAKQIINILEELKTKVK